jgi:preprotein translocase subunit Sss1
MPDDKKPDEPDFTLALASMSLFSIIIIVGLFGYAAMLLITALFGIVALILSPFL